MNDLEDSGAPATSGKATASMICGIVSLLGSCAVGPLVLPVAIVGLVLGLMSMKSANKGFAVTGIITSAIALLLAILVIVGLFFFASEMKEQGVTFEQLMEEAEGR